MFKIIAVVLICLTIVGIILWSKPCLILGHKRGFRSLYTDGKIIHCLRCGHPTD